jgi:hypothetical protein
MECCCVCYEEEYKKHKSSCNHPLCVNCYHKLKEKLCPLCRRCIKKINEWIKVDGKSKNIHLNDLKQYVFSSRYKDILSISIIDRLNTDFSCKYIRGLVFNGLFYRFEDLTNNIIKYIKFNTHGYKQFCEQYYYLKERLLE